MSSMFKVFKKFKYLGVAKSTVYRVVKNQKEQGKVTRHICIRNIQGWAKVPERLDYSRTGPRINFGFSTLYSAKFLELLDMSPEFNDLFPNRENPQVIANDVYFQQDGAPPHYARILRDFLDNSFDVCGVSHKTCHGTRASRRILAVADNITPKSLHNVQREFVDRLAHCQAVEGFQFEHLTK
ncbi:hypothetical protein NQ317_017840 [Molorchus minor]|uniref:Transposase n=1 Tax=Molorchus minor TaxID=1323400 RepID=A0ABQ9K2C7_9CUCU|nr:hypothetical protein NQ317_017840 [Molorchus minor]